VFLLACAPDPEPEPPLTEEQALDPVTCAGCHPDHYDQWQGSMHAYSSYDPVFIALNAAGQEATGGALGTFCVDCHAPTAAQMELTADGLDIDSLPASVRGIGCTYCHTVDRVGDMFNNGLGHASDLVQRGSVSDPVPTAAHESAYSPLHDRTELQSSDLCGSCHDVVVPSGMQLERTWVEWNATQYATATSGIQQTCGNCHMDGYDGRAAISDGAPERRVHDHSFPAVDTALIEFPGREAQAEMIQERLDPTVLADLLVCASENGVEMRLRLENVAAGHSWPSGAAQHRRGWVEIAAYQGDTLLFESGNVPEGEAVLSGDTDELWWFGDRIFDADGNETHAAWDAVSYESNLLLGLDGQDYNHVTRTWYLGEAVPTRAEAIVHLRALDVDFLQWLVDRGHLDPGYLTAVPTWDLAASAVTWSDIIGRCPE